MPIPDDFFDRRSVQHPSGGRQMTKLAEQDASDINVIMRRWKADGVVPVVGDKPRYGDFSRGVDFHDGLNRMKAAGDDFDALPSEVRKRCDNDPGKFLDLVSVEETRLELVELGLPSDRDPGDPSPPVPDPAPPEPDPEPVGD